MKKNKKNSQYLTLREAADYLGVCENTFRRYHALNIPGHIVGKSVKYKIEDIDKSLERVWGEEICQNK